MNESIFTKGDKVIITTREGGMLRGTFSHKCPNGKAYIKAEDGRAYEREFRSIKKVGDASTSFEVTSSRYTPSIEPSQSEFEINDRFEYLQQLVRMVIKGNAVSMIVTGSGGLGKSFTVKREIIRRQLDPMKDYIIIKGYSTPRGLYRTLFENNGKLIIFDDCDEVLVDNTAKNLLKGALDSYDERVIHWITKTSDESLPDSFDFTGRVIFISNKSQDNVDQAILSRSMCIDLTMSRADMLKRMRFIIDNSKESLVIGATKDDLNEGLALIEENLENIKELSLRSLEKVVRCKIGEKNTFDYEDTDGLVFTDWKKVAKYMLVN